MAATGMGAKSLRQARQGEHADGPAALAEALDNRATMAPVGLMAFERSRLVRVSQKLDNAVRSAKDPGLSRDL